MAQAPAPWIVSKRQDRTVIRDADTNEVCEVFTDARLIAAAPDLLAALEMIREAASGHVPLVNSWVLSVTRAAISKANGE